MAEKKDNTLHINKYGRGLLTLPLCETRLGKEVLARPKSCMEFFIKKMNNLLEEIKVEGDLSRTKQMGKGVILAGLETEDVLLGIMCLSDFFKKLLDCKDPGIGDDKIQRYLFNLDFDKLKEKGKNDEEKQGILCTILSEIVEKDTLPLPLTVFLLSDSEHISTIIRDNTNGIFYSFDSMGIGLGSHKSILPGYVESLNEEKIQNTSFCGYITMKFCKVFATTC